ncbi:ground-like domain protein [Ancylostoma duodenale]|uniref:Ground-like domain protein n=1 Tax=Ancylostoma duodenale TaxID=51022 RepID=A0A0C2DA20_9BILA|nr:ground-like domain protein [Ancylostoma duodenale]
MARLRKKGGRSDGSCTDESLRKIMHDAITDDMTESKRAVHRAVISAFKGSYGVLCAECAFSYIIHTQQYCVHTRHNITCLVYKDA